MQQKGIAILSNTHAETEPGPAKDLRETRDDLAKKKKKFDLLRAKDGLLEKGLSTLCDAPNAKEQKINGLEPKMALDTKAFAHLATLVNDYS